MRRLTAGIEGNDIPSVKVNEGAFAKNDLHLSYKAIKKGKRVK